MVDVVAGVFFLEELFLFIEWRTKNTEKKHLFIDCIWSAAYIYGKLSKENRNEK